MKYKLFLILLTASLAFAMSNGAPALDCSQCHIGAAQNPPKFIVKGIPKFYEPGKIYNITVKIVKGPPCHPDVACGGFAVAVSAGKLIVIDKKDTFVTKTFDGKEIITHTPEGAKKREWTFAWQAPKKLEPVIFSIAVNAVNGDGTYMGDSYGFKNFISLPKGIIHSKQANVTTIGNIALIVVTVTRTVTVGTMDVETMLTIMTIVGIVIGGYLLLRRL